MELGGKVALVTGGTGGVGEAVGRRLADLGATVALLDIADERGARLAAELGNESCYHHLDVSDADAWAATVDELLARYGRIDVVHLNAGTMSRPVGAPAMDDPLLHLSADTYRRVMAVNADGVALGILSVLPHFGPEGGDIVVTISAAGLAPVPFDPFYTMSKHALVGLVRSLGMMTLSRSVRLNGVCPGGVDTALVPPDLRTIGPLSPPSYIADTVVRILESGASGEVWLALEESIGAWPVPMPDLMAGQPAQAQ